MTAMLATVMQTRYVDESFHNSAVLAVELVQIKTSGLYFFTQQSCTAKGSPYMVSQQKPNGGYISLGNKT